jgi:hypothetical protein
LRRITALLITTLIFSSATTLAQTRRRTSKAPSRTSSTLAASAVQRTGATRVADQIKTLSRFIYLLGGVAKGIEQTDEAIRRNEASPAVVEQARRNKATLKTRLQSVREGLDKLEIDFRATPELQRYYIRLAGTASGAAAAEDQAAANQFDRAGRTLLDVVSRLTDVLLDISNK